MATQRRFCGVGMTMSTQHGLETKILLETVLIEQNVLIFSLIACGRPQSSKDSLEEVFPANIADWHNLIVDAISKHDKVNSGNRCGTRYTRRSPENRTQRKQTLLMHAFAAQALCFLSQQKTIVESFRGICPATSHRRLESRATANNSKSSGAMH